MHITTLTDREIEIAIELITPKQIHNYSVPREKIIRTLGARYRASSDHLRGFGISNVSHVTREMNKLLEPMGLMIFCEKLPPSSKDKLAWSFFRI